MTKGGRTLASAIWLMAPAAGYIAAAALLLVRQLTPMDRGAKLALALIWLSLAAHAALMGWRLAPAPTAPLTGVREFTVLLTLLLVVAYLLTARWLGGLGIATVALAVAGLGLVAVAPTLPTHPQAAPDIVYSPWLLLHVPLCLLAYLMYGLAGSGAAMYLLVSGLLKARRPLVLSRRLPTLEASERFAHHMAELGFPLLTAGIMAGMVWSQGVWGELLPETPKQILALVAWGVYAAYFHARLVRGIRGRTCAWLLVAGLAMVVAGLLAPTVTGGPHKFI